MKKILLSLMSVLAICSMTSCGSDDETKDIDPRGNITGCWVGNMGTTMTYHADGTNTQYKAGATYIEFLPGFSQTTGYGYMANTFGEPCPVEVSYSALSWELKGEDIEMMVKTESGTLKIVLRDYHATDNALTFNNSYTFARRDQAMDWTKYIQAYGDFLKGNGWGFELR